MGNTECVCFNRSEGPEQTADERAELVNKLSELEDQIRSLRDERDLINQQCQDAEEVDREMHATACSTLPPNGKGGNGVVLKGSTFHGATPRGESKAITKGKPPRDSRTEEVTPQQQLNFSESGEQVADSSRLRATSAPSPNLVRRSRTQSKGNRETREEEDSLARFVVHSALAYAAVANLSQDELVLVAASVAAAEAADPTPRSSRRTVRSVRFDSNAGPSSSVDVVPTDSGRFRPGPAVASAVTGTVRTKKDAQRRATVGANGSCALNGKTHSSEQHSRATADAGGDHDAGKSVLVLRQAALDLRAEVASRSGIKSVPASLFASGRTDNAMPRPRPEFKRRQTAPAMLKDKAPKISSHISVAEIGRKLVELLFEFPDAATTGIRWRVLERLYEERHGFSLEQSSPSVQSALMFDGLRRLKAGDTSSLVLGLEDEVLLAQSWIRRDPGHRLCCWPSLYAALCLIIQEDFGGPGSADGFLRGPLSGIEPFLRARWHPAFNARSLGFRDSSGRARTIPHMRALVEAMLQWRTKRLELMQEGNKRFGVADEAILPRLELEGDDLILRQTRASFRPNASSAPQQVARPSVEDAERELLALRAKNAELRLE